MLSNIHPKYRLGVHPKNEGSRSFVNSMIDGHVATIVDLEVGKRGWFVVLVDDDYWERIHTSIVEDVEVKDGGSVKLTTHNTVYIFDKIN